MVTSYIDKKVICKLGRDTVMFMTSSGGGPGLGPEPERKIDRVALELERITRRRPCPQPQACGRGAGLLEPEQRHNPQESQVRF